MVCIAEQVGYRIEPFGEQHSVPAQRKAVADLLAVVREALTQHGSPRHRAMQQHCIALNCLSCPETAAAERRSSKMQSSAAILQHRGHVPSYITCSCD